MYQAEESVLITLYPVPSNINLSLYSPALSAYLAAYAFASHPSFSSHVVTRTEYQESGGTAACRRKFRDWKPIDVSESSGKGKGRAREEEVDWEEEEEVTTTRRGGRGRPRGGAGGTKKK